jgi:hypothetical protein
MISLRATVIFTRLKTFLSLILFTQVIDKEFLNIIAAEYGLCVAIDWTVG